MNKYNSCRNITPDTLHKQAALHLINQPHIFYEKVQKQLMEEDESYQLYCINIFNGIQWGEPIIAAALSHMWNIPINIVTATKYWMTKLFPWKWQQWHSCHSKWIFMVHQSNVPNYTATELIVPDQEQGSWYCNTIWWPHSSQTLQSNKKLVRCAISCAQHHTQDHILTEFHNISRGTMVILKRGNWKRWTWDTNGLEMMWHSLAGPVGSSWFRSVWGPEYQEDPATKSRNTTHKYKIS